MRSGEDGPDIGPRIETSASRIAGMIDRGQDEGRIPEALLYTGYGVPGRRPAALEAVIRHGKVFRSDDILKVSDISKVSVAHVSAGLGLCAPGFSGSAAFWFARDRTGDLPAVWFVFGLASGNNTRFTAPSELFSKPVLSIRDSFGCRLIDLLLLRPDLTSDPEFLISCAKPFMRGARSWGTMTRMMLQSILAPAMGYGGENASRVRNEAIANGVRISDIAKYTPARMISPLLAPRGALSRAEGIRESMVERRERLARYEIPLQGIDGAIEYLGLVMDLSKRNVLIKDIVDRGIEHFVEREAEPLSMSM